MKLAVLACIASIVPHPPYVAHIGPPRSRCSLSQVMRPSTPVAGLRTSIPWTSAFCTTMTSLLFAIIWRPAWMRLNTRNSSPGATFSHRCAQHVGNASVRSTKIIRWTDLLAVGILVIKSTSFGSPPQPSCPIRSPTRSPKVNAYECPLSKSCFRLGVPGFGPRNVASIAWANCGLETVPTIWPLLVTAAPRWVNRRS